MNLVSNLSKIGHYWLGLIVELYSIGAKVISCFVCGIPWQRSIHIFSFNILGDALARVQLSLPRAEARGHRGLRRLHQKRVEDVTELAKNFGLKCEFCQMRSRCLSIIYLKSLLTSAQCAKEQKCD